MAGELRVLSLNCWGLPQPLSKAKQVRMRAIAARLALSFYDIVGLQELWVSSIDYVEFKSALSVRFPYSKFFYGGSFGMGLAIFSRFPIVETQSRSYTYNGWPVAVAHGDWIVGKGAGCATISVQSSPEGSIEDGFLLDVWVTHTVAAGGEDGPEHARCPRITQTYELAHWARESAERGRHVIALGDFNCTPPSLSTGMMRHIGQFSDAFLETHPSLPPNATTLPSDSGAESSSQLHIQMQRQQQPDPQRAIDELGVTCDSPLCTWTAGKKLDARAQQGAGKRLDYIYYTGPRRGEGMYNRRQAAAHGRLKARECQVCFTEPIPGHGFSYTDHFGVEAVFDIASESAQPSSAFSSCMTASQSTAIRTLELSINALTMGQRQAGKQQRTQLTGFFVILIIAVALVIGSGFQSVKGVGVVFTFLSVVAGWGATTLLYSGLIWGEWEKRIYTTFRESMALELAHLQQPPSPPLGPARNDSVTIADVSLI
ncbi:DNase I-like protein [Tilletiaria anomala UBC 951]|uniref:DNase I-like protein n=1 Tax=Tilletiaria anomala (strain ATCC 24038 / CBS 436.72 / UBC 951) TaxID=1037660 RepID=A0A066WRA0_TILAU|nr:DNase I-like protein [Tilletiaria anomala UBC 951]KDN53175.1 DNase I-like protein [Tilletiaria anomala UBC 951]